MGFVVEDTPFNRSHYSDLIGKWFDKPPSFAHVREINDTIRTIRASIEDGTDYLQIDGYNEWRPPSFGDIVSQEMGNAASRLKTSVVMNTASGIAWVDYLTTKVRMI